MNPYVIVVIVGGLLALAGAVVYLAPAFRGSPDDELGDLPPTPLQRRARWALGLGLLWCAALVWILSRGGPVAVMEDRADRLLFTAVLLAGVFGYLGLILLMRRGRAGEVGVDERDQQILARASEIQGGMTLICLAVWGVALTEIYWEAGAVPIAFPSIIFWSTFVVYLVSHSAGILLGYALWRGDAQG